MKDVDPAAANLPRAVAIIGGGIAGLAAAHRLAEIAPGVRVTLFEASDRLGGVLQTETCDDYLVEHSADMFITQPEWAVDLCRRIGLADELIGTDERRRAAFVVRRGRLMRVPDGFALLQPRRIWPVLATPLLSWRGKLRVALEYFVPRPSGSATALHDESLASFARRRLGCEAFERLVQPLVGGIYGADPERLSLAATLPRFLDMEREYRSLMRAAWQQRKRRPRMKSTAAEDTPSGARYGMFVTPRRGMASLVEALTRRLSGVDLRLRTSVERLSRMAGGRWQVIVAGGSHVASSSDNLFDAVVLATPAQVAARFIAPLDEPLAAELRAIEYAGMAIVCLGYRREQIGHSLDGFGFVVPAIERRRIVAASFSSIKFAGRAADDRILIRVFIGGALQPQWMERDDNELSRVACDELADLLGIRGEPELVRVVRFKDAMPQYHLGHLDRVARIEARVARLPGLFLAGSAYRGVGIPHCIHSGEQAAERAVASRPADIAPHQS